MKKSRAIWNYIDMLIQSVFITGIIFIVYVIAENLERYIYRYTIFPFVAFVLIFSLGILLGRGVERTKRNKPVGFVSKKMATLRKKKNFFIFSDTGDAYTPNKEIIEDIKSGEIVHVKQFNDTEFEIDEFKDVYKIKIDDMIDDKMDEKEDNNEGNKL